MKEADIQSKIKKYVKAMGGYCVKVVAATEAGASDLVCCVKGRYVAFEVKRPGEKPTMLQIEKIAQVRKAGGIAEHVDSVEEAVEILMNI